ncbi:hypothetical protein SAMD00020551_1456 [Mesobacillus selenatarsenatis SF-1]|uniref:Uncharacterized protein n=1 Tax=Mesobacillus selenatarsenatis (strain DSM 18680 / JCM 14380 / FERM P-15431 / SF-1) TaxID=1321606 RepID=A0A0A8X243_MESS1|nr:hypothetical protein SAMD00020551_1456 [Mesobacillus selenatarsenatis SF-1]
MFIYNFNVDNNMGFLNPAPAPNSSRRFGPANEVKDDFTG